MLGLLEVAECNLLAERIKKVVELDGKGVLESDIATRVAYAMHMLDDVGDIELLKALQKVQRLQCLQDGVAMLRRDFLVIRRG